MAEPSPARAVPSTRPLLERRYDVVIIGGLLEPADVAPLCERARPLLEELAAGGAHPVACEVGTLRPNLAAVDAVARLALAARRLDRGIRLLDAPPALRELLALAGLASIVPCDARSGLDPGR
ncbi:MAG TPA: hypothetical protein VIL50_03400 [Candidatus Limnocylindrales bacterium]